MILNLSTDDIKLITAALKERGDRLHDALPDPSVATQQDRDNVQEVMRIMHLTERLNPTYCGLHEQKEPCSRCANYHANAIPHEDDTGRGWDRIIA